MESFLSFLPKVFRPCNCREVPSFFRTQFFVFRDRSPARFKTSFLTFSSSYFSFVIQAGIFLFFRGFRAFFGTGFSPILATSLSHQPPPDSSPNTEENSFVSTCEQCFVPFRNPCIVEHPLPLKFFLYSLLRSSMAPPFFPLSAPPSFPLSRQRGNIIFPPLFLSSGWEDLFPSPP